MEETEIKTSEGFSRRDFLVKGGIVFGGTLIILQSGCTPVHRAMSALTEKISLPSGVKEFNPLFWFQVMPDNTIKMVMPKAEMGQGIFTGFAMIAAEELDVEYERIIVVPSSTNDPLDKLGTGGSTSTMSLYQPMREVAAQMKAMLQEAAADHWDVNSDDITCDDGTFRYEGKELTYAKVVELTTKWKNPGKVKLKDAKNFKIIGKDVKRNDSLAKIKGEPLFAIDAEIPGMVYGMFVKSSSPVLAPMITGTEKARQVKGVLDIIEADGTTVVIASNRYAAEMGARAVEVDYAIPYQNWTQERVNEWVKVGNGEKSEVEKKGFPKIKMKEDEAGYFTAEYRTSAGSHAQMEPNGAIAHYEDGKVKIIAGIQALPSFRKRVAKTLDIKEENVHIQNSFLGGGFGRKTFFLDIAKIALVSKKIGKPVHIFHDRTQEFQNGYLRPPSHHAFEVMQSESGKIEAIKYDIATDNMLLSHYPKIAESLLGSDPASAHGARISYDIKNIKSTYWKTKVPYTVGSWRGIGMFSNTFAIESLMDELALKIKMDPIEFRIMHLDEKDETHLRQINVLKKIAKEEIWRGAQTVGTGKGFACADDRKTIVATVAEVKIEKGKIKVTRIVSAIDAGRIVNPEGVRQQVEGCAIMGLGATLMEKVELNDEGVIGVTNFHQYPVPLLTDIPEIKVILVESELEPLGVGEPPIAPISAAIANAVFNLTGKRLRSLPLSLDDANPVS